jgi:hypothetical protein
MKTWPVLVAFLILSAVPSRAQQPGEALEKSARIRGEMDILALEQEVDTQLLREALITRGHVGMSGRRDEAAKQAEVAIEVLERFIKDKKHAIVERAIELKSKDAELANAAKAAARPAPPPTPPNRPLPPPTARREEGERQEFIKELEEAQVEVELLQMQSQMYRPPLNEAMETLAAAEFAASTDESQRDKADAARKRYVKAREKYLELSKKLHVEQTRVNDLQNRINFGGMMGGGMR